MQLRDYIKDRHGAIAALARETGSHAPDVSRWASGVRPVPPERCPALEKATGGQVPANELRPDIRWVRVPDSSWPHPEGRPCIDVAATREAA